MSCKDVLPAPTSVQSKMADPRNRGDLLKTNMTPDEKKLAGQVKTIRTTLGSRNPSRLFRAGQTIRFTYRHHTGAHPDEPKDNYKEIFVLHPSWQGKMQGIDMKRLTSAEREVLTSAFDPQIQADFAEGKQHRLSLVNDILRRMDPSYEIGQPASFYMKFVKPFIRGKDVYRTFFPRRMWNITIEGQGLAAPVKNQNPLFKKIVSKANADIAQAASQEHTPAASAVQRAMKTKGQMKGAVKPSPRSTDQANRLASIKARHAALKKPSTPK